MRIEIAIENGSETHERVQDYAREHGLLIRRAYAELVKDGLDANSPSSSETVDTAEA